MQITAQVISCSFKRHLYLAFSQTVHFCYLFDGAEEPVALHEKHTLLLVDCTEEAVYSVAYRDRIRKLVAAAAIELFDLLKYRICLAAAALFCVVFFISVKRKVADYFRKISLE